MPDKKFVEVQLFSDPSDLSEVGVVFRSTDGTPVTAQEMLDALSDALIVDSTGIVPFDMSSEDPYDA